MSRQDARTNLDQAMTTTTTRTRTSTGMVLSIMMMLVVVLLLTAVEQQQSAVMVEAFVGPSPPLLTPLQRYGGSNLLVLSVSSIEDISPEKESVFAAAAATTIIVDDDDNENNDSWKTGFDKKNTEYLSLTLKQHKPLGCTVEESLSSTASTTSAGTTTRKSKAQLLHYVFVTKVVDNGNAAKAGILPGDVIIGVTDTFGQDIENVAGLGIDKVKSLVSARPQNEPLQLRIARGTNVVQDHEVALAELCSNGAANDVEIENCVLEYLQSGYDINTSNSRNNNNNNNNNNAVQETLKEEVEEQQEECDPSTEEDCLLDQMYSMWADDMSVAQNNNNGSKAAEEPAAATQQNKVKPWSSRSSPSGTWVRDPKTGEMRNIDA